MINIVINNNEYRVPTSWAEVTLNQARELQQEIRRRSTAVREYFASQFEPSAHEPSATVRKSAELIDCMANSVNIICGVPREELLRTDPAQIADFVDGYMTHFIVSLIFEPVFEPENISQFEWEGETLVLPASGEDIMGTLMPLENVSAEQLCHATDLHVEDSLRYAAAIVAILCRPEGEPFAIKNALRRAKTMGEMPMSIVFEVFFCLRKHISI